jgi:putative oxidoreductase
MRLMVGAVFITSGLRDPRDPDARSKSIGMSRAITIFLDASPVLGEPGSDRGCAHSMGGLGVNSDGARCHSKKIFVWRSGFWGEKAYGWHYDLMLVSMNLVILFTNGGNWVLWN